MGLLAARFKKSFKKSLVQVIEGPGHFWATMASENSHIAPCQNLRKKNREMITLYLPHSICLMALLEGDSGLWRVLSWAGIGAFMESPDQVTVLEPVRYTTIWTAAYFRGFRYISDIRLILPRCFTTACPLVLILVFTCPRVQHSLQLFSQFSCPNPWAVGQEPQGFCPVVLTASPPHHLHLFPGRLIPSWSPLCHKCHCHSQSWLEAGGKTDDLSQSCRLISCDSSHLGFIVHGLSPAVGRWT